MYGSIAKVTAAPGKRDEFIAILKQSAADIPGCLSYVVASDPADENVPNHERRSHLAHAANGR
jgi:quinol monooxygenase YgiN